MTLISVERSALFNLNSVDLCGRHETPAGLAGQGETPQARSAEEAHRPPAESEVPGAQIN